MKLTTSTTTALFLLVTTIQFKSSSGISRPFALKSPKPQQSSTTPKSIREKKMTVNKSQQLQHKTLTRGNNKSGSKDKDVTQVVDYGAMLKYTAALAVQATLSVGMWMCVDWAMKVIPKFSNYRWFRFVLVYFLNLQVGIVNLLPTISEGRDSSPGRKRPSWTPPGWVFVLMWPLFVFGTRAYTMVVVADKVGRFVNPVTIAMMVHFGISGLWSHVNRVENQLGLSMLLLYALFGSKAYTAYLAYQIDPRAGIALACTLSWIGAASALGTATWRINPNPITGKKDPFLPLKKNSSE